MLQQKNAKLILEDGTCFNGYGFGASGLKIGEICFNTSMTGYQEVLTDPSYLYQIIVFTFPIIGIVGTNHNDNESDIEKKKFAQGLVVANYQDKPSNFRSELSLNQFLIKNNQIGISGLDTRALTIRIRNQGVLLAAIIHDKKVGDNNFDINNITKKIINTKKIYSSDLTRNASSQTSYQIDDSNSSRIKGYKSQQKYKIVVIDFGAKKNILNSLVRFEDSNNLVKVFPNTTDFQQILNYKPDGIVLSNGPGDPINTFKNSKKLVLDIIASNIPCLGICLGYQLLAIALYTLNNDSSNTNQHQQKSINTNLLDVFRQKMTFGHRGINHPVMNLSTNRVEITSQNHGYKVDLGLFDDEDIVASHISLFDKSYEGFYSKSKPIIAVQFHPEASPGPHDSSHFFLDFFKLIKKYKKQVC